MSTLLEKGIVLPSGEINKTKINLVSGAITQPFADRAAQLEDRKRCYPEDGEIF